MAIPFYKALFHAHIKNALFEKKTSTVSSSLFFPPLVHMH